jgi:hypothetical protein
MPDGIVVTSATLHRHKLPDINLNHRSCDNYVRATSHDEIDLEFHDAVSILATHNGALP